ncbi:MerC domain-containing protein [Sphingobium sp. YR768]|uniref:MerC domain-containing protein n=1 Tax=Sphingobium sp. YR768 TaxID=1884365 RepID=UPI0008AD64F4|nr:MerC domain-containing protein [Sphingobium sp. YR768]SER93033.1 MerC mercury resistance protein [Sphingobium sp. YR768]
MSGFETERAACGQLNGQRSAGRWLDGFALCASSLCTLHCLGLPLLFALLPAFASRIDPGESFHIIMLALAVPTSLFALIQGRRRGGIAPLMTGMAGLALMTIGALAAHSVLAETLWTVTGSLLLAGAHILNWRRGLSSNHDAAQ